MKSHAYRWMAAVSLLWAAGAAHAGYSALYVFGDSLSDTGNDGAVLQGLVNQGYLGSATTLPSDVTGNGYVAQKPFASGAFTNGPAWVTPFAAGLGVGGQASLLGGTNYAYGGAETSHDSTELCPLLCGYPYSLATQKDMYLDAVNHTADASALYVVAGGGNNARNAFAGIATADPLVQLDMISSLAAAYAQDVGAIVDDLQAAGAKDIVVWDTPNIGLTPSIGIYGTDAQALGLAMASAMNSALSARLSGEAGVSIFSVFGLLSTVAENAGANGFTNVTDACAAVGDACDPAQYLFWDGVHPTARGHEMLAQAMLDHVQAVPEPGTYALMLGGLAALAAFSRRRARQLGA